jgi:hypothetical protein
MIDNVLELRQYTLHPGQRDTLIELFDREFVESQEAVGAHVIGQFRDLESTDRFVWLRGFRDMPVRVQALQSFYGGAVWRAHRNAANATMIDSDDVLLLCPVAAQAGFSLPKMRPSAGSNASPGGVVVATIYLLKAPADTGFSRFFAEAVRPEVTTNGAPPLACFKTLYAENDFPALPVREGVHAFVWFAAFASLEEQRRYCAQLSGSPRWREQIEARLAEYLAAPAQMLLLEPTSRSRLRHEAQGTRVALPTGSVHDFDFLVGEWQVANRRLQQRGVGCQTWDEFPASQSARLHLSGLVNTDEIVFHTRGWSGMTVRVFNLERRQWFIYWVSSREGILSPPVIGSFDGARGEFYGQDHDGCQPVEVRFIWTRLGADAACWEQAFCYDGRTWETNWTMQFTRI